MSIERTATEVIKRNTVDPAKRIAAKVKSENDPWSKPGTLLAETLKEGARLPIENAAHITKWTLGKMGQALKGTLSLGFKGAMLIPLPLPGGFENAAQVKNAVVEKKLILADAIERRTHGDNRPLRAIVEETQKIRDQAHAQSTGQAGTNLAA